MAKWQFDGLDEYVAQLHKLEDFSTANIGRTVWHGAKVVADHVKEALKGMPVDDRRYVWSGQRRGISPEQRDGLVEGFGIAPIQNYNGYINVKLGFAGYNNVKSKEFPEGQPNLLVARMVESGTSFMPKIGTVSRATNEVKKQCEETMRQVLDEEIAKITK